MKRSLLFGLAAVVACPTAAFAAEPPFPAVPPTTPLVVPPTLELTPAVKIGGFNRIRVMNTFNYDLNGATAQDAYAPWTDVRSVLNMEASLANVKIFSGLDLAGTDFDDGFVMGYDNPARQRPISVMLRHLYLDYKVPEWGLSASLGRQPARLGYGIVSSINRDSFRLAKALPDFGPTTKNSLAAVWVRGAKGNTVWSDSVASPPGATVGKGVSGTNVINDPNGASHDLATYALVWNTVPAPDTKLQAFAVQQIDSSEMGVYPSKRYLDVNGEANFGPLKLGGEATYYGGMGPRAATGRRATNDSFALFLTGAYRLGDVDLGLMAGRGGGDVDAGDGLNNNFQSLFIDESSFAFNHLFGDDLHGFDGTDAGIARGAGFANMTFVQPYVTWRMTPDLFGTVSYTKQLTSAPVRAGSGVLGTTATTQTTASSDVGDEVDLRLAYQWGATQFYGAGSTFVPGTVFANPGFANAAYKLELGTEVRF